MSDESGDKVAGGPSGPEPPRCDDPGVWTRERLLECISTLRVWARAGERAPHKPLLVLFAVARARNGCGRLMQFDAVEDALEDLLEDFGPPGRRAEPLYPFWHLQNDCCPVEGDGPGLWEVVNASALAGERRRPTLSRMRADGVGGFSPGAFDALVASPELADEVASLLLHAHFPPSIHDEILSAVGMPDGETVVSARRTAAFRRAVLEQYRQCCAVCRAHIRFDGAALGLDAAHIRWFAAGGPDELSNGLALCAFHHRAFDRGALGLDDELHIVVSHAVHGGAAVDRWLLDYQGQRLARPIDDAAQPAAAHVAWHRDQVVRGSAVVGPGA